MDAPAHPTAAELEAFDSGKLGDEAAAAVRRHLAVCPDCRRVAGEPPAGRAAPPELAGLPGYEVVRELGHGGMGVVYLARNRLMERSEVLKVIARSLVEKPAALERFRREIVAAGQLQHPNIVT